MKLTRGLISCLVCALLIVIVTAQATCPAIVETALEQLSAACENTGRNQACYGFDQVSVDAFSDAVTFTSVGDLVALQDITAINTAPMDEDSGTWGISLLRVQANLPDTLPGQNVTMLIFGDTQLNDTQTPATLEVVVTQNVNIRAEPSTDAEVISGASRGAALIATGQLEDGTWLRVRAPQSGQMGWISARFLRAETDFQNLAIVTADDQDMRPMQAFFVRTGVGTAPCAEAPRSGLLIQTPDGVGEINLSINGLEVELGSTAFVQARPGDSMEVSVLEGQAVLRYGDVRQIVPAGAWSKMPLNPDGTLAGSPRAPLPYKAEDMQGLPVGLFGIEVPPPLTQAELDAITGIDPRSGRWLVTLAGTDPSCNMTEALQLSITPGMLEFSGQVFAGTLLETAPDTFTGNIGIGETALRLISSTRFEGTLDQNGVICSMLLTSE